MSYKFRKIQDIANDIKTLLSAAKDADENLIYKNVRIAAITSYEQLFDIVPHLSLFPAAVVCIGTGQFGDNLITRNINPGILIVDEFEITMEDKAAGIWNVIDATTDLFIPGSDRELVEINGVSYTPLDFRPITLKKSDNSAYLFELKTIAIKP